MSARGRTGRDWRRRQFGQNFLDPATAAEIVDQAGFVAGELVIEIGAGSGAFTLPLARQAVQLIALEPDRHWAGRLQQRLTGQSGVRVVVEDFMAFRLPRQPFRVVGSLPFGRTTAILRRLLDDPTVPLMRADVVVQWGVAVKRAATPPTTLLSTAWAPWWEVELQRRIPAARFRPVPRVDAGLLRISRRLPALLPAAMAGAFAAFLQREWPFTGGK